MKEIDTNDVTVLTIEKVINLGIEFKDEVCYSGQVFNKPMEEGGIPITGLIYERNINGTLAYYSFYENGIPHGVTVEFYKSGNGRAHKYMENGTITGRSISWFDNGEIKSIGEYKYGFIIQYKEWDDNGMLLKEKQEPTDFEKEMIIKYDLES